jgi:hypothetical protein
MRSRDFDSSHNDPCATNAATSAALELSHHEFAERCGDPTRLIYKGQCYDAGSESANICAACGGHIRFCYILKLLATNDVFSAKEIAKCRIGDCCFHYFPEWNPELYRKLVAAEVNLRTLVEAVERDKRVYGTQAMPATKDDIGEGCNKC